MAKNTKWYTITINYIFADGQPSQYTDRIYGQKQIQKQIEYATQWLKNHNRQIVGEPVVKVQ